MRFPAGSRPLPHALAHVAAMAAVIAALAAPAQAQDPTPDIIRGRVVRPDSSPVAGAQVKVTSVSTQAARTLRTNDQGRFSVIFQNGGGDYIVNITAIGMQPVETRVRREGDEEVLLLNVVMRPSVQNIDAARIAESRRPRPEQIPADVGGTGGNASSFNLPANLQGDLLSMIGLIPGFSAVIGPDGLPLGFSALGLAATQNNVTLNGAQVGSNAVPRDANVMTRVSTTTADGARGGFSGAQVSMTPFPGSPFTGARLRFTVDDPALQWSDPATRSLDAQFRNFAASGNHSGEIVPEKTMYNLSWQLGRRSSPLNTLLSADSTGLVRLGLSPDSVQRFEEVLSRFGVPFFARGVPADRVSDNGSFLSRFDLNTTAGGATYNATLGGNFNKTGAASLATRALPSFCGTTDSWTGNAQLYGSMNATATFLNEIRLSANMNGNSGDPYLALPQASVLVSSADASGGTNVQNLQFGSSANLSRSSRSGNVQVQDQLSWFSDDSKHRLKLAVDPRYEWYNQLEAGNTLGTVSYNSIADLEAGRPTSFVRRLGAQRRTGSAAGGSLSLTDTWRRTDRLQFQYSIRGDVLRFLSTPAYNPNVDRLFGLRTDRVPNAWSLSPRAGVSWTFGTAPRTVSTMFGPQSFGTVSGSVGRYWSTLTASSISDAVDNTGLPSGQQQITCIGSSIPALNWNAIAQSASAIPSTCADGTAGSTFTVTQPSVRAYDRSYEPPSSWRGNVRYSGYFSPRFRITAEVTHSLNEHLSSAVDRNFAANPRFTIANEGARPVFADASAIVPVSGAVSLLSSRRETSFGQVLLNRGDARSISTQLSVTISPTGEFICINACPMYWTVGWSTMRVREQVRGFGGNTAGNPLDLVWTRGTGDLAHTINFNVSKSFAPWAAWLSMNVSGQFRSGQPFTPMVSGDVNGDGVFGNDRAFVFDPAATAGDSALTAGMRSILGNAPGAVRGCLERQLGRIAERNSCRGPWTASNFTLQFQMRPAFGGQLDRFSYALTFANPLTGLDAVVHGGRLQGWGQPAFPDQTLLYVRGFDPATQRFRYEVNQRFGETRAARSIPTAPFQATLEMRMNVGPSNESQSGKMSLRQFKPIGRPEMDERAIKARYVSLAFQMTTQFTQQKDSLKITPAQMDSISKIVGRYSRVVDSVWTPLAAWLAKQPRRGNEYEVGRRIQESYPLTQPAQVHMLDALRKVLEPEQRRKLKPPLSYQLDEKYIEGMRSSLGQKPRSWY